MALHRSTEQRARPRPLPVVGRASLLAVSTPRSRIIAGVLLAAAVLVLVADYLVSRNRVLVLDRRLPTSGQLLAEDLTGDGVDDLLIMSGWGYRLQRVRLLPSESYRIFVYRGRW